MTTMLLLAVISLLALSAHVANGAACDPPCTATETCEQVFNSQAYFCVSPGAAAACNPPCTAAEVCKQVFNSEAYHCEAAATSSSTTPTASSGNATTAASPTAATPSTGAAESAGGDGLSGGREPMLLANADAPKAAPLMHASRLLVIRSGLRALHGGMVLRTSQPVSALGRAAAQRAKAVSILDAIEPRNLSWPLRRMQWQPCSV